MKTLKDNIDYQAFDSEILSLNSQREEMVQRYHLRSAIPDITIKTTVTLITITVPALITALLAQIDLSQKYIYTQLFGGILIISLVILFASLITTRRLATDFIKESEIRMSLLMKMSEHLQKIVEYTNLYNEVIDMAEKNKSLKNIHSTLGKQKNG